MNKYDKALQYEIFINQEYAFAEDQIKKAKIIFDIGAYKGDFTAYCLSINPSAEIHMFEPVFFQDLAIGNNVYLNNFGIGTQTGKKKLYINEKKGMQTSAYNQTFLNPEGKEKEVEMKRLDEYMDELFIEQIDMLKMDIEGMEFDVLLDLSQEYFNKIKTLIVEYHILDENFRKNYQESINKLKTIYKNFKILPNKYSSKLGYFFASF